MTTVFISATSIDLSEYVQAVENSLQKAGYQVNTMSNFGAQPDEPRHASLQEVEAADYLVGLYARRYGYIPEAETLSITEQEYHHARQKSIPVFAFRVDETNTVLSPGPGEDNASDEATEKQKKLDSFLSHIQTALVRETFSGIEDLKTKVLASLSRYEKRMTVMQPPVNTLRIRLGGKRIELFQNDQLIGSSETAFDPSWRHALEDYKRAKSSPPSIVTKDRSGQVAGALEIVADKMGRQLGEMVFFKHVAKTADLLIKNWQTLGEKSQVALQTTDAPWPHLPLETLIVPGQDQPLALVPHLDLFRMGEDEGKGACPDIHGPLKILMAVAAPWEGTIGLVLDYEQELGKVMDIVEQLPDFSRQARRPIVHILDQGTLDDICDAFQRNRYHILHISCHGQPGALHLEKEDGTVDTVTAADLVTRFPAGRRPALTVLSACHTGAAGELTSFADHLVQNGFSYVMAMQEAVSDTYATIFTETFYRHLAYAENPVIENGFTHARIWVEKTRIENNRNLAMEQRVPPEWMVAALYKGNVNRFAIYEVRPERFDRQMEVPVESFDPGMSHRQIGEFVGRRRELLAIKNKVLAVKYGGAVLVTGMGGVGKSTLVARALADAVRKGETIGLIPVIGRISLVDLLQEIGCQGQELEQLLMNFFKEWLPEQGPHSVFLFDNFEENLFSPTASVPEPIKGEGLPELEDVATARFLSDLIYAGKSRILITSRYPFQLPDCQHRALKPIELGTLSPAETRKLMIRLTGFEAFDRKRRHQVARHIGGHPRTLEFLDAIMRDGRFTYPDVERRLLKKLPQDVLHRLQKYEDLSISLRQAAAVAARDCFVDQLLELLSEPEKELLFLFSVFQEPKPLATLERLKEVQELEGDAKSILTKLIRLSLITPYGDRFSVHRWTAEYLKKIMGEALWRQANRLAGDHFCEPDKISLDEGLAAWQHYLESGNLEISHKVATGLEDKLDTWGHWDLRRIVCETMLEQTKDNPSRHAKWLQATGILNQAQGDYDGAREQYQKSLEILEKLGDLSGMARSFHQLGNIQYLQGDYDGAREQYQKSLEISEKLGDLSGMASSYHQQGNIRQDQGDYDGARKQYQKSLEISEKLDDLSGMARSYHQLGILRQAQGDYDGARDQYQRSFEISEKLGDLSGMASSYHQQGNIRQDQGDYDGAQGQYQKSLEISEKLGDLSGMARSYHQLGILRQAQGDYDGARDQYQRSFEISEKLGDLSGMARSYHQQGNIRQDQGDYDGARKQYQKSLEIKEELGDLSGMASSYHQLGILRQVQGDYDGARKQYQKSLEISEKLGDLSGMARSYHQLGILRQAQGDYDGARKQYQKSLEILEKLGGLSGMARSYHQLGNIQYLQGDYDGAREQYQKSLEISEKLGDLRGMASSNHQQGNIRQDQGNYEGAREQYQKSLEISEKIGDLSGMARSYQQLGILRQAQGDYDGAREQYQKSFEISEKLGDLSGMANSYHQLGILRQAQGDYDGARQQYQKSLEISEKLGDLSGMARSYHQLGILRKAQGDYDGARQQYQKSLEIKEKLGDLSGMANSYHQLGILRQAQVDYNGAWEQYQKSLEIKEKLGDPSGMASSYGQMGLLMRQLNKDQEAFELFLQTFMIFARLKAPAVQQSLGDLCRIVRANPNNWRGWLTELVKDEDNRSQIEELILQNLKNEQPKSIQKMKELYDQIGEEAFLAWFREQTAEDLPNELLEILRSALK